MQENIIEGDSEPLTYALNGCITKGEYPNVLNFSGAVPIFKKGDETFCAAIFGWSGRKICFTPGCLSLSKTFKIRYITRGVVFYLTF